MLLPADQCPRILGGLGHGAGLTAERYVRVIRHSAESSVRQIVRATRSRSVSSG